MDQLIASNHMQSEKEKLKTEFIKYIEKFFYFNESADNNEKSKQDLPFETYSEEEIKKLSSESFFACRIENAELPFEKVWKSTEATAQLQPKYINRVRNFIPPKTEEEIGKKSTSRFLPRHSWNNSNLMYGGQHFYCFFRLLHCLYERLIKAHSSVEHSMDQELEKKPELLAKFGSQIKERLAYLKEERYEKFFLVGLNSYLRNELDASKYEDFCRHFLGAQAYIFFNVDKLINSVYCF